MPKLGYIDPQNEMHETTDFQTSFTLRKKTEVFDFLRGFYMKRSHLCYLNKSGH